VQDTKNQEQRDAGNQSASCCVIESSAGAQVANLGANALDAQLDDLCCLTRVASGRIARANDGASVELETLELTGSNRSGVPAAALAGEFEREVIQYFNL
jgi:hypothetical protein